MNGTLNPNAGEAPSALWVCPRCRGRLERRGESLLCMECAEEYPVVAGIPDFRAMAGSPDEVASEYRRARELHARASEVTAEQLIFEVFSERSFWSADQARSKTRMIIDGVTRLSRETAGWLAPCLARDGPILDLGCGAGQLMAALGASGRRAIGVDLSLGWLVIANKLLTEKGINPELAAGEAEFLPLPSGIMASVISLDVIEHVEDPSPYLREIDRVLADTGTVALTTPNRFSLAAEPHVSVWGVGWLPRRLQKPYAEWRSGMPYERVRLLSLFELHRLFRRETRLTASVLVPEIPQEDLSRFPPHRRALGRFYNVLVRFPPIRAMLRPVAPFYRVLASSKGPDEAHEEHRGQTA